jgi:hypothetical protein
MIVRISASITGTVEPRFREDDALERREALTLLVPLSPTTIIEQSMDGDSTGIRAFCDISMKIRREPTRTRRLRSVLKLGLDLPI